MTATLPEPTVDQPAPPPVRAGDPRWVRPAFLGLLALTALLYLWGLGASGWANQFYSAAVQAGAHSWKAMFFGSSDSANFITVDKPPASLWVMELSARLFGVNAWSILVPQALEGVAAVAVVYAAVKRRFSAGPALLAGAVLALTPVAALMFRFNNPDALLALLLALAGYAVQRAQEQARTRWLLLAATCVGFAFLTKTLQAFLVLPAFGLSYLLFAPTGLWRRVRQLLLALVVLVVSSGWWVAVVELTPAQYRPYIGGSQHDDFLELTFGYNGFGRITGSETGSVGGGGGGATGGGMWGATGITRLFTSEMGGQIAWLLPAAFLLLVAGLWWTRRAPRTDGVRAALVLWGTALVTTFLVFSFMAGIFHPYYNVALAPYLAVVTGIGAGLVWERRGQWAASGVAAGVVAVTCVWAYVLLARSADWLPWLRWTVLLVGLAAASVLAFGPLIGRRLWAAAAAAAVLVSLAGPAAYSVETAATAHSGSLPSAGPSVQGAGFGGGPGGGRQGGGMPGAGTRTGGAPGGGFAGGFPGGGQGFRGSPGGGTRTGGGQGFQGSPGGGAGGAGGLLDGSKPGTALTALLKAGASGYSWVAAAVGSQNAAGYQLASDAPVMAVGGFNGTDPAPTLAEFESLVRAGKVHYFLGGALTMGGGGSSTGGSSDSAQIASWVARNYSSSTVDGVTVYDLTKAKS